MPQISFPNSRFDALWYAGDVDCDVPCRVRFGDGHIEVTYVDGEDLVRYTGTEIGDHDFQLTCPPIRGKATLHMFRNSREMVGYWVEEQSRGMWRIHLAE